MKIKQMKMSFVKIKTKANYLLINNQLDNDNEQLMSMYKYLVNFFGNQIWLDLL